jgi:tRNA pseudouridine65 synthase
MTSEVKTLEIIFENKDLIAISKPHGLLVHKTNMAKDATEFALQLLRNQVGYRVYPSHRIDRKTSGVLLFSKSKELDAEIQQLFRERKIRKTYLAIVRGYTPLSGIIDYAIGDNKKQDAITRFETISHLEIDVPCGNFQTSRYSYIRLFPETGRYHQLRKHMAHIFYPIIGDRPHGCNKQNRFWKEHFGLSDMMLHAESLSFTFKAEIINIQAPLTTSFKEGLDIINYKSTHHAS